MFTGIIEEIGAVRAVRRGAQSAVLEIGASAVLAGTKTGDSIAVGGICLTVTALGAGFFSADVMHETLDRSTLGALHTGDAVNLERAMPADGRFGGHIVSGHIDGTGTITAVKKDDNAVWYTIRADREVLRHIIEKGSIAIDGISLTVARLERDTFSVSVIPHTAAVTTLSQRRAGDRVNLENDCIGKYVARLLGETDNQGGITRQFLLENGF
ncbi:MAG: riboflavin synthase [Oscillospiraceae bacterium]|nr:riboflavin synthase [Oscillospiraceae bacterium]